MRYFVRHDRLIAAQRGCSPEVVGSYRVRSPLQPLTLGQLATLAEAAGDASRPTDHR